MYEEQDWLCCIPFDAVKHPADNSHPLCEDVADCAIGWVFMSEFSFVLALGTKIPYENVIPCGMG